VQDSLGKIVVTTPGIPVRATVNRHNPAENYHVHGYAVQRLKTNKGDIYVSLSPTDDRVALSRILCILSSTQPSFSAGIGIELNGTNLADVYFDADNAGDGVTVGVLIS
jgi:hypothetical protein